jgi:hypothetical protein
MVAGNETYRIIWAIRTKKVPITEKFLLPKFSIIF